MTMDRRTFLKSGGACAGALAIAGMPDISFAGSFKDYKLVTVTLKGGADGLTMFPPYGDPSYAPMRGTLAVPAPGASGQFKPGVKPALYMSDLFGMNAAMPELHGMFLRGEMTLFHATALTKNSENTLSHFNEILRWLNGLDNNKDANLPGWVNRLLTVMDDEKSPGAFSITGSPVLPGILRGPEATGIFMPPGMTPPEVTMQRLSDVMGNRPVGQALAQGVQRRNAINAAMHGTSIDFNNYSSFGAGFPVQAQIAATLLASDPMYAPSVAALEMDGYDWHSQTDANYMNNRMSMLSKGLDVLVSTLKAAGLFEKTLIVVTSEFGRSVRPNGDLGSDHGTTNFGFIITGDPRLKSNPGEGIVVANGWPGLNMTNGQNQYPSTSNFMNVVRGYLQVMMGLSQKEIDFVLPYNNSHSAAG